MRQISTVLAASLVLGIAATAQAASDAALQKALNDPARTAKFVARDPIRHPAAELAFFRLRPTETIVEVDPGGGYWTEILAPYLHGHGTYYATLPTDADMAKSVAAFRAKMAADPARYSFIKMTTFGPTPSPVAPPGSADLIMTFRNLHNWMDAGYADQALSDFYTALKPGGLLGMEEHRGPTTTPQDPKAGNGYVRQDYAIALAEKAGFKLVKSSELLANPKDTKNYPKGVWTLPPTFALGDQDHAKYAAIGEADNFLLLFQKPKK